jgi:hypothetical protein
MENKTIYVLETPDGPIIVEGGGYAPERTLKNLIAALKKDPI